MKLRIQASSITLRLSSEELPILSKQKGLNQSIILPGGQLTVLLELTDADAIGIHYDQNKMVFSFPENQLEAWIHSGKVGFTRHYEGLTLTIEKDMPRRSKAL